MKSNIVTALASLAHEHRLNIFRALVQAGEDGLAAGKLSEIAGIAPSSISFHMKELLHANMVDSRNEGRFVIYSANFTSINELVAFLTENCCEGEQCLPVMTCKPVKKSK